MNMLTPCGTAREAGRPALPLLAAAGLAPKRVVPDRSREKKRPQEKKPAIVPPPREPERDHDEDNVIGEIERPRPPSEKPKAP